MMPQNKWLKPPRSLLLILFLLTLVSVSALGFFGWRLLGQERLVEEQRARDQLEQTADRIAATLRRTLAETGDRLGAWVAAPRSVVPPQDGLVLLIADGSLSASPAERLLYRPSPPPLPEASAETFAEGEALEFQRGQPERAAAWYRGLAESPAAPVRAGALLRLARVLRNSGHPAESLSAYRRLAEIADAAVAGAPADLVGRQAMCELAASKDCAEALRQDLLRARWPLTRGQFGFYWDEAARLARAPGDPPGPPPPDLVALSEAAGQFWNQRTANPRGQGTLWVDGRPLYAIWRGDAERRAVMLANPETILRQIPIGAGVRCAAVDGEGHVLGGRREPGRPAAVRTAAENDLPWTLQVTAAPAVAESGMLAGRRFLFLGTTVMVLFLLAGTYFIARAIRREMEVSRMQSDFVSAVSHEFRSPLTSMRQLSEILALGRVPNEERRRLYYETLVRETVRLQRLVEALLHFGRMEAGARQYRFEELDAARLVRGVAAEFEPQIAGQGRHIELAGEESGCRIEADPEAMSVALRNLVDNALKYSPDEPAVWVEWGVDREFVAIRVRDRGIGIAASERKAIFRRFVRGRAAVEGNVKGSGVGLAMVRHIVAAHGGEITVVSEPGRGSTFTMLLPAMGRS
ncbi:MAG: ATP-binding protein [Bryobacteraceae bacterium]